MKRTVIIGLDRDLAEPIRDRVRSPHNRVTIYDTVPRGYSDKGVFYVEDLTMQGTWFAPDAVIYYSYFENVLAFRKALALSFTHSFPYVDATILHDDKDMSLIYRRMISENGPPAFDRGYIPANVQLTLPQERVIKQGNVHCGENKFKLPEGYFFAPGTDSLVEPFIEGTSYRVLVVGHKTWAIRYDSEDWRKNVSGTQTLVSLPEIEALYKAHVHDLHLHIAGVDFIHGVDGKVHDLELNCYPGIPEFAREAFIEEACTFVERVM